MKYDHANFYFPIWVDPTSDDIKEISKLRWDTLHVLETDDEAHTLVIASGYGHTHSSTVNMYATILGRKRPPYMVDVIIYHEDKIAYMNPSGFGAEDSDHILSDEWDSFLAPQNVDTLRSICQSSGLKLNRP